MELYRIPSDDGKTSIPSAPAYHVVAAEVMDRDGGGRRGDLTSNLQDLNNAKDLGLINEKEFLAAKTRILEGFTGGGGGGGGGVKSFSNVRPNPALNGDLNSTARNTNDTERIRDLVLRGAVLESTNGGVWRHTALHQGATLTQGVFIFCQPQTCYTYYYSPPHLHHTSTTC